METYMKSLGADVWISVASGYNALKKPKTAAQKEAKRNNKLAIDTILDGLTDSVISKVGSCASAKDLWDKLQEMIQQEDENLKKLKHVEIENNKLKDTRRKLRSELGSYEKTVVSLKKQLEDFQKLREETISLKTLLEEARRIAEVKKVQMIKKEEDCEKLEQEVVSLRKSLRNSQVPK
jgi:predicted RNase H-like nuclease (RuvC/YqgF family)